MTRHLLQLVELGGSPLGVGGVDASVLSPLLSLKNGFYAFERALHVFPAASHGGELGVIDWNEPGLWRDEYGSAVDGAVYFAEDLFGVQFGLREGTVVQLDPELGEHEVIAPDLEAWARLVLEDPDYWTGAPVARGWQARHGPIAPGLRLLPATPFVLGGGYELANFAAIDAVEGMRFRGSLSAQLRDLPDGAQVEVKVVD